MNVRLAALLMALAVSTPLHAADLERPYQVDVLTDIAYRGDKEADPIKHKLDLYLPKGAKDFPVLMFVHGGSWKTGNKAMYATLGATFAKQGVGVAVVNYRLTGANNQVKHPDHVEDVAAAFAWLHANIGKHGGRDDRLFISGHSAGGHLVSLLATDEKYLKAQKLSFKNIRGVLALSGVYEIVPNIRIFDEQFGTNREVCKAASPLSHITGKHPPFLICYADKDFPSIDRMSEDFCKKLGDGKCDAKALKIDNRNHFTIIVQLSLNSEDPCTTAMLEFIEKNSEWKRAKQ